MSEPHLSDSSVQLHAEAWILEAASAALGVELLTGSRLQLNDATVAIDGVSADGSVLVEVFARQGRLKGGQVSKLAKDALKLITVAHARHPRPRIVLAVSDQVIADDLHGRSWLAESLRVWGVEVLVVQLSAARVAAIQAAQLRQTMTNAPSSEAR